MAEPAETANSRFYVYCKRSCDSVRSARLRLVCSNCESVISSCGSLEREPANWTDVMGPTKIRVNCPLESCRHAASFGRFFFECTHCAGDKKSVAIPLPQVVAVSSGRREDEQDDNGCCIVCENELASPAFAFKPCSHTVCLSCFHDYAVEKLKGRRFRRLNEFYSLACPVAGCDGAVLEAHHFRLLGDELYRLYQRLATEFATAADGFHCPSRSCNAYFTVDNFREAADDSILLCPECDTAFRTADGRLEQGQSSQSQAEQRSVTTIKTTCRRCPNCRVPTERNGGCAHIKCAHCSADWCWHCADQWTGECQWNHWFD